jgi:outer membrane immunogenic protein
MKNLVTAISCSLLLASPAVIAADLPTKSPSPLSVAPAYNWTGFYAGVNAGYGSGKLVDAFFDGNESDGSVSLKFDGAIVGAQAGFNLQSGTFVWGIEGDIQKTWMKGTGSFFSGDLVLDFEVPWFATLRGRAGVANGPALFYVTGGAAGMQWKAIANFDAVDPIKTPERRMGWTVGAGYEAMLSPNWSWKTEYLYVRAKDKKTEVVPGFSIDERAAAHVFRIGANYRFGG